MILLRLISWPYVRKHLMRSLLTLAGIVLGIAVFTGMHTANQSVLYGFQRTVDRIAGATQLQIAAGEAGFDENVLERVQGVGGVRVAVPVIEATAVTNLTGQGSLLILGVDMTGDRSLRDYDLENSAELDDPLVFLAQPDSLLIAKPFASANHLMLGSKLRLGTIQGDKEFTVRGIIGTGGLASAFGGNLAVMDVYAAQQVFGRGRKFDRIDVGCAPGVDVEVVRKRLQKLLGPGFQVEQPSARGQQFEAMSRIYSLAANITSCFALFIGMFIIYNTFSIAVTQRRADIGILRALGATEGQIRNLFLVESAAAGLAGSVLGLILGGLMARAMTGYIGGLLGEIYGVAEKAQETSTDPRLIVFALVLGVLTSMAAAFLPARNAAAVDPVKALQKGSYQKLSARESRARRAVALTLLAGAIICFAWPSKGLIIYAGDAFLLLGVLLLTPALSLGLAQTLRPLLRRLLPVEGTLAADSLIQAPRRTAGAVAALMLSLALVISLAGLAHASYSSIYKWLTVALNPDLYVTAADGLTTRNYRFPDSMEPKLRGIPGISEVQAVRNARIVIRNTPVMLVAAPVESLEHRIRLKPVAGDPANMYRQVAEGNGVVVSENFALLRGFKLGDVLDLPTPAGIVRLPIVGVVTDYSDQQGSVLVDRRVFSRYWNDTSADVFRIYLSPGASESEVKRRILEHFSEGARVFVLTNRDLRQYILRLTDQWFGITYVQIAVAVIVAVLGIINTLTVSITDRRRELGVLQAVGGVRSQIRRAIWIEALAIAFIGVVLGLALGAGQLYFSVYAVGRDIAGLRLNYEYPFAMAGYLFPALLSAALLAALLPAESAVRAPLVEALEYE